MTSLRSDDETKNKKRMRFTRRTHKPYHHSRRSIRSLLDSSDEDDEDSSESSSFLPSTPTKAYFVNTMARLQRDHNAHVEAGKAFLRGTISRAEFAVHLGIIDHQSADGDSDDYIRVSANHYRYITRKLQKTDEPHHNDDIRISVNHFKYITRKLQETF